MFARMRKSKKGFTLIELIVVIAILGILALIAIPRLGGFRATAIDEADARTADIVEKVILTGIASNDILLPTTATSSRAITMTAPNVFGNTGTMTLTADEEEFIVDHLQSDVELQKEGKVVTFIIDADGNCSH